MGRNAVMAKSRQRASHQRYQQRAQRTVEIRQKRRGTDEYEEARKIKKVVAKRPLPSDEDKELLLHQFKEACRLPLPCVDLCALLQVITEKKEDPSNLLAEVTRAFLELPTTPAGEATEVEEGAEVTTVLEEMLQTDGGRRVAVSLLAALSATEHPQHKEVAKELLEVYQENDRLVQHFIACRVLSGLLQYGDDASRQGVLDLMMQRATSPEELRSLLMNRHTSGTVEHLLRYLPAPTSNWLCAVLFGEEEELTAAQRQELVEDPVAGQILQQIAQTQLQLRGRLLQLFSPVELLHTKRGTAFLNVLLSAPEPDSKVDKKELRLVFDTVRKQIVSKLEEMCADRNANFVVQRLLQLIPFCAEDPKAMVTQFVKDMGGADALVRLAAEPIGVHVVLTLIDVAVACGAGDEVGSLLLKRVSPEEMIAHNQGQLVVRRLLPLVAVKRSAVGTELSTLLSNKWVDYAFDSMGNLVVQDYLKALGTAGASKCAATLVKDTNLLRMSQNASASHVVFTLLDLVDGPTQTNLCNALKGVVVQLSTHINGRFIVEKLLRLSREVRDELVKQFLFLVQSKGTQHMLCTLLTCIDGRGRQHVIQGIIVPNLMAIATDASGSVNLQKMMQSDAEVLQAVQKAISATGARTPLLQNFFGKFVVRIAEGGQ